MRERIGPFRLRAQLGEGGFAPVYLAAEEYGGVEVRIVALKLFSLDAVGAGEFEHVVAEARALSRVEHRNVVRYLQIFEEPEAGIVALAMEHVKGVSVGKRLEQGPLTVAETLAVGAAIAGALAAVHAAGLVHRDVKPDNVIDADRVYKLIDFGIAVEKRPHKHEEADPHAVVERTLVLAAPHRTTAPIGLAHTATHGREGDLAGTMGYMDPECLKGRAPDPSSDLYSLGAMLFECLTGRVPALPVATSTTLDQAVIFGVERPPPLRTVLPSAPEPLARLIDALLDPDRAGRPRHAEAVSAELERLRRSVGHTRTLVEEGPFRGLDAFDERHRDIFFGRSADLASALESLRTRGLLALIGASGSGKSSLARAALLPAVLEGELGGWPPRYVAARARPGRHPRAALDAAFASLFGPGLAGAEPDAFVARLAAHVERSASGIVLYIDALEELVAISEPSERDWTAAVLAILARTPVTGVRVIVSARRDFLDRLLAIPQLGSSLARSVQLVAPLGGRAFVEALEDRLAVYGYALEDAAMLAELERELDGAPEAMPLFEFALERLWRDRDQASRRLTRAALARIGGIAGALERHAEEVLDALVRQYSPAALHVARAVLISLSTASGTRARRTADEVVAEARADQRLALAVLAAFEQARLVVGEDGKLTLAHEALLDRWPRLRDWVVSVRKERELASEIEQAAARWKARGADRAILLRGRALHDARVLVDSPTANVSAEARSFVQASSRWHRRGVAGVSALVGSVIVGLGVLFVLYRVLEQDAHDREHHAAQFAATLEASKGTPEDERVRAVARLLEEKRACERELERCGDAGSQQEGEQERDE